MTIQIAAHRPKNDKRIAVMNTMLPVSISIILVEIALMWRLYGGMELNCISTNPLMGYKGANSARQCFRMKHHTVSNQVIGRGVQ
jgi:hypothetical protein